MTEDAWFGLAALVFLGYIASLGSGAGSYRDSWGTILWRGAVYTAGIFGVLAVVSLVLFLFRNTRL